VRRPLVSIVTPTMNRRDLLEWTLRSVRGQSYPNLEHIVVDGGSTDGTLELLEAYEPTYRMRWISEPDRGMYEAINKGLRMADGEVLAYVNSDDLYFPWTLDVVVDAFERHPTAGFVYGDALSVDDETGRQRMYWQPPFDLDLIRRLGFLAQPTVFWRKRVFEAEGNFDETLRYVADCDYWMRAGGRWNFVKINEVLAVERDHRFTLRESGMDALMAELEGVRSRYVSLEGPRHQAAVRRHHLRAKAWKRVFWIAFALQASIPKRLRRGPWARFLATGTTRLIAPRLIQLLLPGQGDIRDQVMAPSRYWLEPPA
jgi:glycosyltransferase involved in cell wall biosynthesis